MAEERVQRRLAGILAADVVGYSRLMGEDEEGTLATLKAHLSELIIPKIDEHSGRTVKTTGDGLLSEFASVVDAARCAIEIQAAMTVRNANVPEDRRFRLRMAVNLGDIIVEGDDIFGDGVNVAARLESLCEPGDVVISGSAYEQIKAKLPLAYHDMGLQTLKNIADPIRTYRIRTNAAHPSTAPTLPDKPSIAVLPFANMSGDSEQEYFADGIVEEIITALSRFHGLFVIARNSSFAYKGRNVDVKQVGRELGVRYVLEGSVRRAANRIRITGQLIDATTGAHLWANRFEGGLEDVFDLQDRVASNAVGAIAPRLERAEIERAKSKPTANLDAYDCYLRGFACVHQWTKETNTEALSMLYRAIELDPSFSTAYGMAARCYSQRKASGWNDETNNGEAAEAERLARRAIELGGDDAVALCTGGMCLGYVAGDMQGGMAAIESALALNPNYAWAWLFSAWMNIWIGRPEVAIERVSNAMRLSPNDPHIFNMQSAMASAFFTEGRYDEALIWAEKALGHRVGLVLGAIAATASAAMAGEMTRAATLLARLRQTVPNLRTGNLRRYFPLRREQDFAKLVEGLRIAGLTD